MNTTEISIKHKINSFSDLFKYAKTQFLNFEKIEGIENWKEYEFSIDCSEDQIKFKDMLEIRFIEELTEASHSLDDENHFLEEMTDSLNFLLSSYIMADYDLEKLENPENYLTNQKSFELISFQQISVYFYPLVHQVGAICNLLKNRPWTQSNYLVSLYDFDVEMNKLWKLYWQTLNLLKINKNKIFELFERKYLVNLWRIKTGY